MIFPIRICRHPQAAEAAGGAVVEPLEHAAAPGADKALGRDDADGDNKSKNDAADKAEDKAKPGDKAVTSDWAAYQKMQEKFERNPNARPTKREMALQVKYDGKDESTIEGWTPQDKPQAAVADEDDEAAAAKPEDKEKPAAPVIPKELEALVGEKSPIGAKTLAELPAKVKAMADKIEKMNGDFGAVGRVMQAAGVENLRALGEEIKGAKRLNALVQDLKKGSKEAFAFLGITPPAQQQGRRQETAQAGEVPDGILDEGLWVHVSPQLKKLQDENADLRRQMQDRFKDVDEWKTDNQKRAAETQRVQQINEVITDVATMVQGNDGLWDAKKYGPLNKALKEYYSTNGDYNPGLKPILEILEIAKKHRLENLDVAFSHWDRSNAASRLRQARDEARQPFTGKQPSVGLSDQQGNHSGQFKEYTKAQVQNMGKKGYPPIDPAWTDASGTFLEDKVPAYARPWLFGDNEE